MRIGFFINRLNSHQAPIADAFYKMLGNDFVFLELCPPTIQSNKGSRQDYSSRPYLIQVWKNNENRLAALRYARDVDVAIFGAESLEYEVYRLKYTRRLSFELSERWLKRGLINLLSPRLIKYQWYYHTLFYRRPLYKLCAGAFVANDQYLMLSFRNRCYKWGYFPDIPYLKNEMSLECAQISTMSCVRFMWCARMLKLKHPELPVLLASRLKKKGFNFIIDYYGDGPETNSTKELARALNVEDKVFFHGAQPNNVILSEMRNHDIFLFTSDRKEGWGAVVNEAMEAGCVVVSSNMAGCSHFLIEHHVNGCIFESNSIESLEKEVLWLYSHLDTFKEMKNKAIETIITYWNPTSAVRSLLSLIHSLNSKIESPIKLGPASKSFPIR